MSDLMADLRAAVEARALADIKRPDDLNGVRKTVAKARWISLASHGPKLLALLEAGKAVRQHTTCLAEDYIAPYKTCGCRACKVARQYDEAAK